MTRGPVDDLQHALDLTGALVAGVGPEQWTAPTPCADWTVRDLVNHLVHGHRAFAAIVRDEPVPAPDDHLGDDPVGAYGSTAADLAAAFRRPGVMEKVVTVPIGPVPGVVALHLRLVEALVHGWDLARATGQPLLFPDALVEQELAFTEANLSRVPPERTPFGAPQPVQDDVPPIDRLAARLGRHVGLPTDP